MFHILSMSDETLEKIADRIYQRSIKQYEEDTDIDTSEIFSTDQFFEYVDKVINAAMAHNERYTEGLVREIIDYYQIKMTE